MDALREKVKELIASWKKVYGAMQASPQAWQPHLPYSTPPEIDEVISTINFLLDRSRAPSGFAPTFRIAKGFAATALNNAVASVKNLETGQYATLPTFLIYLNQILAGFLTMVRFSDNEESRKSIEELGGKLAESLSLIDTAQKELSDKVKILSDTEKIANSIEENAKKVEGYEANSKATLAVLTALKSTAEEGAIHIKEYEKEISKSKERLENEIKRNEQLSSQLNEQNKSLSELQKDSKELDDLIHNLLPDAASAGLAAAFAKRVTQLERSKWIWMIVFLISIICLVAMAFMILYMNQQSTQELWKIVLQRLPFTAPLIWLGWFSAVQYGNTVRVQEDYAFKEATAKAFVGYKDHMDHLADVNIEDTKTAMKLLASKTIEILSHEPLRIYQKSSEDVSPTKSIFENITGRSKSNSEKSN